MTALVLYNTTTTNICYYADAFIAFIHTFYVWVVAVSKPTTLELQAPCSTKGPLNFCLVLCSQYMCYHVI